MVVVETSRLQLLSTQKSHQNQTFKWKLGRGSRKTIPASLEKKMPMGKVSKIKLDKVMGEPIPSNDTFCAIFPDDFPGSQIDKSEHALYGKRFGDNCR